MAFEGAGKHPLSGSDLMLVLSRSNGLKIIVWLSAISRGKARVIDHSLALENQVLSRRDLAVLVALGGTNNLEGG